MELYVHIPFCVKKCNYCDFLSMPADDIMKEQYVQALKNEIRFYGGKFAENQAYHMLETVYFGGGTPSVLPADLLVSILDMIRDVFFIKDDAEITIEINPATIGTCGLHKLKNAGFNRLSIGLQSTDDAQLKKLGRIHSYEQFAATYQHAREAGFDNINIDYMSSLPGQSREDYTKGLHKIIELQPEHISSYSLILEEGTPFYDRYADHPELLPDEDCDREMYHDTKRILQANGYDRYEISNYAKPGYESAHNSGYWKRVPYLGVGLGAASFYDNRRTKNTSVLITYINILVGLFNSDTTYGILLEENVPVLKTDAMAEYFYLGLRMTEGVSIKKFEEEFGCTVFEQYGKTLKELEKQNLILINIRDDSIRLTDFGTDISNWVFEKFL